MSIRSIHEVNQAAGIKLLWTLDNSSSLWSVYMRNKYNLQNILLSAPSVLDSGTWKFLMKARDAALGNVLINLNGDASWTVNEPSLYSFWAGTRARMPPSPVFSALWFPNHCPKMSICALRAVKGTLLTKDLLIRRTMGVDPKCVLCNREEESAPHLFFKCSYSSFIWSACRLKLGLPQKPTYNINEEILTLKSSFTKRSGLRSLARLAIPTVVWHVWRERNNRIFHHKEKTRTEIMQEILSSTRILCTEEPKGSQGKRIMDNWL